MTSETDISDNELPNAPATGGAVEEESYEAANDLVDDAALASAPEDDDEGGEETEAPAPAEADDDVIDPEGDIGNFASGEAGQGLS